MRCTLELGYTIDSGDKNRFCGYLMVCSSHKLRPWAGIVTWPGLWECGQQTAPSHSMHFHE